MPYPKPTFSMIVASLVVSCGGHVDLGGAAGSDAGSSSAGAGGSSMNVTGSAGSTGQAGGNVGPGASGGSVATMDADVQIVVEDAAGPAATPSRRVIFFYTPHGTILDAWRPTGDKTALQLGQILSPLTPFKSKLLILEGLDNDSEPATQSSTHESGPSVLLTAKRGASIGLGDASAFGGGGPSLDVSIGAARSMTQYSSLQLGVRAVPIDNQALAISFAAEGQPLAPRNDPRAAFSQIFGNSGASPPSGLGSIDSESDASMPAIGKAQIDILVDTLRYDLTRSATLSWVDANSSVRFSWLGIDASYLTVAHQSATEPMRQDFIKIQTWYAQQFAYLLSRLSSIPAGAGTLLDSSLVVWLSETGEASTDSGKSIPVVMAGSLAGYFATGQYRQYVGRTQADLLLTIGKAFGIDTFGDPSFGATALTDIVVQP